MVGDKRKGKEVAEPKKKKTRQQKEWERVLTVPDTQGQPQRASGFQRAHRVRGSSPRVSSSSSRQSSRHGSSSSHVDQAEGTRPQSSQTHHLTRQVRTSDTRWSHTATADTVTEESCSRRAHRERESSRL
jgi:hypothetical protein